ncbi:MAG TPA: MFS transporter, partial [Jatrophihabitans sp.]|nr:MFS transporter [Jatrophihabitans sp.]
MSSSVPEVPLGSRRGKLILTLLCSLAFLDFVDASIVNIALPDIRRALHFSVQDLQWVPSGYLLTYGGFMLLGGRLADLLGRRRVLLAGTVLIGVASLVGGLAQDAGLLVAARLFQGVGAALMLPAALSTLTTTFRDDARHKALGVWGGVGGLASAVGVFLGGVLTDGPGWRWVMLVNPVAVVLVLPAIFRLLEDDRHRGPKGQFDFLGAVLATAGMLLLVYALVKAPDDGWGATRTVLELAGAGVLLIAFVVVEQRGKNPLLPLAVFRIRGLAAANVTQLIAATGIISMFYFLTLYMQNVLGYSPLQAGSAYLPLCFVVGIGAGISSNLLGRIGSRPLIIAGAAIASGGIFWLSRIPVDGSFLGDLLPGMLVMALGLGIVFVAVVSAANAGVPAHQAGLAAALLNAFQQLGGALGLAVFSAIGTARTNHLLHHGTPPPAALTSGFRRALLACSIGMLIA